MATSFNFRLHETEEPLRASYLVNSLKVTRKFLYYKRGGNGGCGEALHRVRKELFDYAPEGVCEISGAPKHRLTQK